MSLPAPYSEVYLAGDGVTTEFAFGTDFTPISAELVKCSIYLQDGYEIIPTYTVDMTVGSITISALTLPDSTVLTAPPLGSTVRIYRDEPEAQNVTASQLQAFTAKQLERALDAIVAMIQEVSYTTDHKTIRLTEPQRDIALQELGGLEDGHLIYWDNTARKLVVTNYPQQDVVRCVNGLFFRLRTNPGTNTPYLQWSTDNSDWHSIDVDSAYALANDAYTLADSAYNLASTTRGELNAHKADHNNPHETSMAKLIDTNFNGLTSGQFLQFNGINWVNVDYNTTVTWGGIVGNIDDQTDLKNALDSKVDDAGDTMTGALNIANIASSNTPLLTLTHSSTATYKWNLAPRYNSTTLSVYPGSTETNGFRFATTGFVPASNNARYLGSASLKWKGIYVGVINNGADLTVPNKTGTLATMGDVELAARSGRMITDQGVWYAKMYSATTPPAAENGTNYADFSQVDGQGNPIIVIYERQSGAWVQTETITPPAEYDGYVPITSKIWDIAEQAGQQGGRILWNHQSKEFTPYPVIISFEDIEITGESTVIMPYAPSANQIVNKDYVDTLVSNSIGDATITLTQGGQTMGSFTTNQSGDATIALDGGSSYHPDLFDWKWADHQVNDIQWLRADTFSWQSGSVYQAAFDELFNDIYTHTTWYVSDQPLVRTYSPTPAVGDPVYYELYPTTQAGTVTAYDDVNNTITVSNGYTYAYNSNQYVTPTTETVAGITVTYYPGTSGRKIVPTAYMSAVESVYAATGVAWYYIIDVPSKRFKLPRTKWGVTGLRDTVGKYVDQNVMLPKIAGIFSGGKTRDTYTGPFFLNSTEGSAYPSGTNTSGNVVGFDTTRLNSVYSGDGTDTLIQPRGTQMYLYFYVGEFTQTAIQNTAGLNAGLFNGKADTDLANVLANIDFVIERQEPTAGNNYTWYRKYRSGWVEQGGISQVTTNGLSTTITMPVEMSDTNYTITVAKWGADTGNVGFNAEPYTVTQFKAGVAYGSNLTRSFSWQVSGMAA